MTQTLFQEIRRLVREEVQALRIAELGVVQELHPHASEGDDDNYGCTVRLRDSGLVLGRVPVATSRIGRASIPALGDLVLVQFIGGDVNAPVITGSLYNDEARPPLNDDGQVVWHLPLDAGEGDAVHLEVRSGDTREVRLSLGTSLKLELKDGDPVVRLDVNSGAAELVIDSDGAVSIKSTGSFKFEGAEITLKGQGVTLEAAGEMNIKGAVINLN